MKELEFINITGERSRVYRFADSTVTVDNVTKICARPSGTHRLETADGRKFIVSAQWLSIEIIADDWSA